MERFEIGFQITINDFVPIITSDYNHQTQNVMMTSHTIRRFTHHRQTTGRPNFSRGLHPVQGIDDLYFQSYVKGVMDDRIGVENRRRYFTSTSFLARGHFAAKTDFPFAAQQKATFYHLNCFPQFQGFNNMNWGALEESIREHDFGSDVTTSTHVEGTLYLPNARNEMMALHLMENNLFPVPQNVRKIIITHNFVYGFLGFNHPNIQGNEFNYLLDGYHDVDACDNEEYSWLRNSLRNLENRRNQRRGLFLCLRPIAL